MNSRIVNTVILIINSTLNHCTVGGCVLYTLCLQVMMDKYILKILALIRRLLLPGIHRKKTKAQSVPPAACFRPSANRYNHDINQIRQRLYTVCVLSVKIIVLYRFEGSL